MKKNSNTFASTILTGALVLLSASAGAQSNARNLADEIRDLSSRRSDG